MTHWASRFPTRLAVIRRYSIAVLSVAAAFGLALLLRRFEGMAVASFLMAIALTTWYAGLGAGFLAIVLSILSVDYFFTPPLYQFSLDLSNLPYLVVFTLFGLVFSWFSGSRRRTEQQLRQAHKGLEVKVAERTAALRRSEALLTEGERLAHSGTWAFNPASKEVVFSSAETYRLFGFEPEKGAPSFEEWAQRIHPKDRERVLRPFVNRAVDDYEVDFRTVLPDGTIRDIHGAGHPVFGASGDLVEFVGTAMDVTERKRTEEMLRETGYYLTEGERLTHTGSYAWSADSGLVHVSAELLRIFGFDPEQPAPLHAAFRERVHPDDLAMFDALGEKTTREGTDLDWVYRIVLPHGTLKYLHVVARAVFSPSGKVVGNIGTTRDITELKRAEQALRRSEAYLAEAQKLSHTGSWTWSPITRDAPYWSEEMFRIYGLDPQQGAPTNEAFWERVHPEDRDSMCELMRKAAREKTEYEHDHRTVLPDGTIRHIHAIGHPVLDRAGDVVEFVGTAVDVTERKRAEEERERLRQLETDLAHIGRVTTLGELAASLAHELNQPITAAITNANTSLRWLARAEPDLDEAREAIMRIVKDGTRAAEVINRLRSFYKKGTPPQPELVDVNEVAHEMMMLLRNEANRYSIAMRTELAPKLPRVMADHVQLQQVFMNLMINGIEAMKEATGELTVKSERTADGQVLISVSDTGVGLPADKADQIFNAFFTTKPHGTGMGLAITRSIIEAHGGRLWASANGARGATFHFTLPNEAAASSTSAA
jgi:PAS domain S-box-containing protein